MRRPNESNNWWKYDEIKLRQATAEDWEWYYAEPYDSSAQFLQTGRISCPVSLEEAPEVWQQERLRRYGADAHMYTVQLLDNEAVGYLCIYQVNVHAGTFTMDLCIGKETRGRGYGIAAVRKALRFAFDEMRLHKFHVSVLEENIAARHILQRIGCQQEGIRSDMFYHQGKYWNQVLYGLTAERYRKVSLPEQASGE